MASTPAQSGADLKPYRMDAKGPGGTPLENLPGDMIIRMGELKTGKLRTRGPDEKTNQELFRQIAQYYVFKVTHDQFYTTSETGELRPRNPDQTIDGVLAELEARFILVPPSDGTRITGDQMDYIIEFGTALDAAVTAVLNNRTPPTIIRVNAARMLALAAKSGAPAHGKTILALLDNKFFKRDGKPAETPPEVLYHTLRAAEGFFAAHDPRQVGTPRAGYHWLMFRSDDLPDLLGLIGVLEKMALNGPAVADKAYIPPVGPAVKPVVDPTTVDPTAPAPKVEPKGPAPEQLALVKYFRRQAVRALAKVRFDTLPLEANPAGEVRPALALAKIAVADASISPTVTVAESIEAAIGLCGILPSQNLNMEMVIESVGKGVRSAYAFQGRPETEKVIAWKLYSARLKVALEGWQKNAANNPRLRPSLAEITALANLITVDILNPIDMGQKANLARLDAWVSSVSQRDPNRLLYKTDPQSKLNPRDVVAR